MNDSEIRGQVLKKFYDLRHSGNSFIQLPEIVTVYPEEELVVANICDQLAEKGLIEWKSIRTMNGRNIGGGGKITSYGVDVVEGTQPSPITVTFSNQSISVAHSSHVHISGSNVQDASVHIRGLASMIENADLPAADKAQARSLLEKLGDFFGTAVGAAFRANAG